MSPHGLLIAYQETTPHQVCSLSPLTCPHMPSSRLTSPPLASPCLFIPDPGPHTASPQVKPVVSDLDCFLVGAKNKDFGVLPEEQVQLHGTTPS